MGPEELAAAARAAVDAGAHALHVHPRDDDGAETMAAEHCAAVLLAIRAACPGTPVGLTTALTAEPDPARRLEHVAAWTVLPDFVSVNVVEPGFGELTDLLVRRGIGVEAGLWSLDDAGRFLASDLPRRSLRVLVEADDVDPDAAVATARAIARRIEGAGVTLEQVHHGEGPATWAVVRAARKAGYGVRIGLEDTLTRLDGRPAASNAELVADAAAL
jgi:uncharacterized protein (DUF849 family)